MDEAERGRVGMWPPTRPRSAVPEGHTRKAHAARGHAGGTAAAVPRTAVSGPRRPGVRSRCGPWSPVGRVGPEEEGRGPGTARESLRTCRGGSGFEPSEQEWLPAQRSSRDPPVSLLTSTLADAPSSLPRSCRERRATGGCCWSWLDTLRPSPERASRGSEPALRPEATCRDVFRFTKVMIQGRRWLGADVYRSRFFGPSVSGRSEGRRAGPQWLDPAWSHAAG